MVTASDSAAGAGRIGVLGGTFDPIHLGHLIVAEYAWEALGLSRVLLVPSGHPPHKLSAPVSDARHRMAMTALAAASNPRLGVSRVELDRGGPSYTIDTVRELKKQHGAEVVLIVGADMALDMAHWHEPDAILAESQVVAAARPGFDLGRLREALGADRAARVRILQTPLIAISSTDIRARVRAGLSIRYLVPEAVEEYIRRHGLYEAEGQGRSAECGTSEPSP